MSVPDGVIARPIGVAMALSFSNLFLLLGFGGLEDLLAALPSVLKFFSGFQTAANLPLLFFIGLRRPSRLR
ncbi:hypothetical protein AB838_12460 [Rhodobacteraceae bacterium (ex Bugula neritina AB1)]|nr:hypothetical protein AB838_12460 [Rhodobacteraceae bacterium (ex Bugula neritina AB1)]